MLRTICMCTQEWSDMPSRSAWTWAMYHQARTCSSSLTAPRKLSSLRLPRVGARTVASATASRGGLRAGPFGSGVGTASPLIAAIVRKCPAPPPSASAANRPGTGTRLRVEERCPVVLLGFGSSGRVTQPPTDSQVP